MKRYLLILLWVAFAVVWATASWAASTNPIETAATKYAELFVNLKPLVFICGAFGLTSIACAAFFGKMDWSRLTFVGIALLFLAITGAIVDYFVSAKIGGQTFSKKLEDTDPVNGGPLN